MNSKSEDSKKLKEDLTFFDLTNIIVGSIVGADIYIASALTAGMIGPFSIIVWLIAGVLATIIALVFAYCSYYVSRVGGPFAFVSYVFCSSGLLIPHIQIGTKKDTRPDPRSVLL